MKIWDKEYLIKKRDSLISKYCSSKDKVTRRKIGIMLDNINSAINYLDGIDDEMVIDGLDGLVKDKFFCSEFQCYMGDIQSFFTSFYYGVSRDNKKLDKIETSKGKILTISKDFYEGIRNSFADRISSLENSGNLRFRLEKEPIIEDLAGQTFSLYDTDLSLVSVSQDNTISDYFTCIHEFGHVLGSTYYRNQLNDYDKYALIEVYPLFFELVGHDNIFVNSKDRHGANRLAKQLLLDNLEGSRIDTIRLELIRNLRRFSNEEDVRLFLKKEYELDDKDIDKVLRNRISDNTNYVFAYMVAVELYIEYLKNKDSALDKLVRIMKLKDLKNKEYYEEIVKIGIIPLSSMGTYIDRLKGIERIYGK